MIYEKLKQLNIFIENEYFKLYVDLIETNILTNKQKFKTQRHHIIPRCYFKHMNLKVNDSKDNLVNLYLSDHIKAHCYLCLCFKDNYLSYYNYMAVNKLLGVKIENINDDTLKYIDDNKELINISYQHVKQYLSENNPMMDKEIKVRHDEKMRSEEVRNKISISMSESRLNSNKKIHIVKDKLMKRISEDELDFYLKDGWILGTRKGRMRIHKDGHENTIWPEDFPIYEAQGWLKGGLPGRVTEAQRKALNESHKNMWTEERKNKQREILNTFYKNNPNFKTKSKHKVKLYNDEQQYIFNSVKECEKFIGLPECYIGGGHLSKSFKLGYINLKNCIYYGWKIEKLLDKEGDIYEESACSN